MTGRNDPCPCGSGKKFKKCCLVKPAGHVVHSRDARPAPKRLLDAVALHQAGRLDEAEHAYRAILAERPGDGDALHYLGVIAFQRQRYLESVGLIERAITANPKIPGYYCNLGNALMRTSRYPEAARAYRRASELDPAFAVAQVGLANANLADGHHREALTAATRATVLAPQLFEAWAVLADAHYRAEHIDEAEESCRRALELRPDALEVLVSRARYLARLGRVADAEACIDRALRVDPGYEPAWWCRLMHLLYQSDDAARIERVHREWAQSFAPGDTTRPMRALERGGLDGRLRVGYLSADFRRHAMRFFVRPILRHHDRDRFEVFCYSTAASGDEVTDELKALAEHWVECHPLDDAALAARIAADRIDVLVDLAGHSHGSRLKALALKPAPVQATMLGYLGPTGLQAIDYRIGDAHTLPPGLDALGGERLVRLPDCQWCYAPDQGPPIGALPALANGYPTFGCFHNLAKLTPEHLERFAAILARVPESRLLIVVWGRSARQALAERFAAAGFAARVELIEPRAHADYMALYDRVDLGLDSYPYSGGTTTFESLWMGVPVVTRRGATQAANGSASILSNLGLEEFVASDGDGFVDAAVRAARDLPRLAELRRDLRRRLEQSPLMDGPRYAAALESRYAGFVAAAAGAGDG